MDVALSTAVPQAVPLVWATLADFAGIAGWAPNVDHSCLTTTQTEGVGMVRRVQTGRTTLLEEVVTWEPGERLAYTIDGLPPVVRKVTNIWELAAVDGATHVTLTSQIEPGPRPPHKLIAKAVGKVLGKASQQMLDGLNEHVQKVQS